MLDMATAYGTFANIGSRINLYPIISVRDSSGRLLEQSSPSSQSVLDPKVAYLISDILSDNAARTPAFGPNSDLNLPYVAVKTGTTNNLRDNWTIGYTPNRLVAVWVGNNDNTPHELRGFGNYRCFPHLAPDFQRNSQKRSFFRIHSPSGLIRVDICTITGQLTCEGCPSKTEYFLPDTQPKTACTKEQIEKNPGRKSQKRTGKA